MSQTDDVRYMQGGLANSQNQISAARYILASEIRELNDERILSAYAGVTGVASFLAGVVIGAVYEEIAPEKALDHFDGTAVARIVGVRILMTCLVGATLLEIRYMINEHKRNSRSIGQIVRELMKDPRFAAEVHEARVQLFGENYAQRHRNPHA